jgi:hypothetical protein
MSWLGGENRDTQKEIISPTLLDPLSALQNQGGSVGITPGPQNDTSD